ncbi:MAG: O-succinylbenzoic acid--CoA ligase, partial [Rhodococcus sp. (in: high G+C Gram-positive bacteria)]
MLESVPIPAGSAAADILPRLSRLLAGDGPAVLPVPADDPREIRRLHDALAPGTPIDDDVALVVATSG